MSQITEFFISEGKDDKKRSLEDWLSAPDSYIEASHDTIQWVFPLHEKSFHSENTPVLSVEDIKALRSSSKAHQNIKEVTIRFAKFLGIFALGNKLRQRSWCHARNHNLLRITRVIRSIRLFGLEKPAKKFHTVVTRLGKTHKLPANTFQYWDDALNENVMASMTTRFLDEKRIDL